MPKNPPPKDHSLPAQINPDLSNLSPQQRKVLHQTLAAAPTQAQFKILLNKGLSRHEAGVLLHNLALR
jgi:hypothetical protein